jgi:hypothetical protein
MEIFNFTIPRKDMCHSASDSDAIVICHKACDKGFVCSFSFTYWESANTTRREIVYMQRWEYRTAQLVGVGWADSRGWRLREINEQEQPEMNEYEQA